MESKFQIALVVLVVLAQLGGALVAAWKKRQAERARAEARQGGGLVVLEQDSRSESSSSSWGEASSTASRPNRGETSWDSTEDDDLDEEYEDEVKTWDEHEPGEMNQAPPDHVHKPVTSAPEPTRVQPSLATPPFRPDQGVRSERAETATPAMRRNVPSRAARLLKRSTLRQAVVAQLVLAPPVSARRLRP